MGREGVNGLTRVDVDVARDYWILLYCDFNGKGKKYTTEYMNLWNRCVAKYT